MSHPRRPLPLRIWLALSTASALALPAMAAGGAVEQALQAVAQAAAEARQSAAAASAAAERIAVLERAVEQLRQEAQRSRSDADALRDQLGRAPTPPSTWLLGALAAGLALLAAWQARQLSRASDVAGVVHGAVADIQASRAPAADDASDRPATAAMHFARADVSAAPMNAARMRPAPAWPPPAPLDEPQATVRARVEPRLSQTSPSVSIPAEAATPVDPLTDAALPTGTESDPADHDVSIDELLDLEQQADFFVVLGQDDAAIELLVEHLRNAGGGGPLPYLKLLEIHRRRGDRSDYERTRARFNLRFNAYAPDWEVDLQTGRNLSDYPGVIPRLQQVWSRPLDSMAELEAMMFRRAQGDLFDLPAYREILFLYALARDLLDRESADTGNVDLLLPLSDGGEFSSTAPTPFLEIGRDVQHAMADVEDRPTAPVDLDISFDAERATSIFDPLGGAPAALRLR